MARIPVTLPPGLKANDTSFSSQGTYRTADHVRFDKDRAEVNKGYERVSFDLIPGLVRNIHGWKDQITASNIILGSNSHLYIWRAGTTADITPEDYATGGVNNGTAPGYGKGPYGNGPYGTYSGNGGYAVKTWAFSEFGQAIVASPRRGPLYFWGNNMLSRAIKLSDLPNAASVPEVCDYSLVTSQRQVLAFGTIREYADDGSTPGPFSTMTIRGSDLESIWDWATTDFNNAFEVTLPGGGSIIAARNWGEQIGVWTQAGLFMGTFTGDPGTVYRFDPVSGGAGLLGPNAVTIIGDSAFWMSPDFQIWTCTTGGSPTRIDCAIQDNTFGHIAASQGDKVVVSFIATTNELRVDYPDLRDAEGLENSRYVTLKLDNGAWSQGIETRTAFSEAKQFQYPLSSRPFERTLPHVGNIYDNASAKAALLAAQDNLPTISGINYVNRDLANTPQPDNVAIENNYAGDSLWGFRMIGVGLEAQGRVSNMTLPASGVASVSFRAKIDAGVDSLDGFLGVVHYPGTVENIDTRAFTITKTMQTFKLENIFLPANLTNAEIQLILTVPDETILEITDIKVEKGAACTGWTPDPEDGSLYDNYARFISNLIYPQTISEFYYEEFGTNWDGAPMNWSLETNVFALDDANSTWLIRGFYPDFIDQQGFVYLKVKVFMNPQDVDYEELGPFQLTPGIDRVDFMATGKMFSFQYSGNGAPASLRMGAPAFDAVKAGSRGSR